MQITLPIRHFRCSASLKPHLQDIFDGEYDLPVHWTNLIILDCGANVGAFSVWASHRFPGSLIHAFEPNPDATPELLENTYAYNVITHHVGVGKPGMRPLYDGVNNLGEASLFKGSGVTKDTGRHVEIIEPLEMPVADILKIDTEGAEIEILQPLIRGGRKFRAVMIEYHREDDRKLIDEILSDYVLIGLHAYQSCRGVVKYIHRDWIGNL